MPPLNSKRGLGKSASKRGFSLIELLIVVAILLILAAMTIPSLIRSKIAANESAAVANLRDVNTAAAAYSSAYGNGYPPSLGSLGGPAGALVPSCDSALLIDALLSNSGAGNASQKTGYKFVYVPGLAILVSPPRCSNPGVSSYSISAVPAVLGVTGQRGFLVDPSGVIRYDPTGAVPNNSSPAL